VRWRARPLGAHRRRRAGRSGTVGGDPADDVACLDPEEARKKPGTSRVPDRQGWHQLLTLSEVSCELGDLWSVEQAQCAVPADGATRLVTSALGRRLIRRKLTAVEGAPELGAGGRWGAVSGGEAADVSPQGRLDSRPRARASWQEASLSDGRFGRSRSAGRHGCRSGMPPTPQPCPWVGAVRRRHTRRSGTRRWPLRPPRSVTGGGSVVGWLYARRRASSRRKCRSGADLHVGCRPSLPAADWRRGST
jgi:hypothetical protein